MQDLGRAAVRAQMRDRRHQSTGGGEAFGMAGQAGAQRAQSAGETKLTEGG